MGKKDRNEEAETETSDETTKATGQGRAVMITSPKTGEQVRRIDYIKEQFAAGVSRGDIARELGVKYQIVFQATKAKKEEGEEAAEATTEGGGSGFGA